MQFAGDIAVLICFLFFVFFWNGNAYESVAFGNETYCIDFH